MLTVVAWIALPPASQADLADDFLQITGSTPWIGVSAVRLPFRTFHPQGMAKSGDRIYLSSVEVVDRAKAEGVGHLFEIEIDGQLRRSIKLGEGPIHHPGGIDTDGTHLWVPVAEYRPGGATIVYRVDMKSFEASAVFRFDDHLGAILYDSTDHQLVGVNWGSRRFYRWAMNGEGTAPIDPEHPESLMNSGHYIDYQDGLHIKGTIFALFGGLSQYRPGGEAFALGGIDLIDLTTLRAVHQVPVKLWVSPTLAMTNNPFWAESVAGGLRFYFVPEDNDSRLFVYDVRLR